MFEIVDGRRTPEHGYTISSPCEPNGSGELIRLCYSWSKTSISLFELTFLSDKHTFRSFFCFNDSSINYYLSTLHTHWNRMVVNKQAVLSILSLRNPSKYETDRAHSSQ